MHIRRVTFYWPHKRRPRPPRPCQPRSSKRGMRVVPCGRSGNSDLKAGECRVSSNELPIVVILARENDEAMAADTGYMHRCCNLTRLPKEKYLLEQSVPKKRRKDENEAAKTYPKLRPPTHFGDGGVFSCDDSTIRALFCTTFSQLRLEHSQATVLRTLRSPHLSHIIFFQELESNRCQSLD